MVILLYPITIVQRPMSNVKCLVFNAEYSFQNIEYQMSNVHCLTKYFANMIIEDVNML